jgi:hypothetical protein
VQLFHHTAPTVSDFSFRLWKPVGNKEKVKDRFLLVWEREKYTWEWEEDG